MSSFVEKIIPQLTKWRRSFHQYPELGFLEYVTTYKLGIELEKLGFTLYIGKDALKEDSRYGVPNSDELKRWEDKALEHGVNESWMKQMRGGFTGIVAKWDTQKAGDHVAFRFDIDALPIDEAQTDTHLPYKKGYSSANRNTMHACGHDGHMTIGLGVATYIAEHHENLKGSFTLLFQPAEEGGRGARAMTDKGWLDDVDYFYSGHIGIQSLPVGTIAATTQGFLASAKFNVHFKGVSSHAGMHPELGKNALLAVTTAANNLYTIPRHADGVTRVNVGKIMAGSGRNIIPETGYMEVEVRGETEPINQFMVNEATRIVQSSADLHNVTCEIDRVGMTEEIVCSQELIPMIDIWCRHGEFVKEVIPVAKVSGSEDASFMVNRVQKNGGKATYMLFGTKLDYPHHHPSFDFEEAVLPVAVDAYVGILKGGSAS